MVAEFLEDVGATHPEVAKHNFQHLEGDSHITVVWSVRISYQWSTAAGNRRELVCLRSSAQRVTMRFPATVLH